MKTTFFSILTALSLGLCAQNIQLKNLANSQIVPPNSVIPLIVAPSSNNKITFDIKNLSTTTKTINAKRYDLMLNGADPDVAAAYFCFGGLCYGATTTLSPNAITLGPGKSASDTSAAYYMLVADLDEASTRGCSQVKYTFFDVNQVSDSVQVLLKYNCAATITTSIVQPKSQTLSMDIFPNPAIDAAVITVNVNKMISTNVNVINSLGQTIMNKPVIFTSGKNNVNLNLSGYPAGVYFVSINTGETAVMRKLIIE